MSCEAAREGISALLDGEIPRIERSAIDAHLAGCAACRAWREEAHEVTRRARIAAARPVPAPDPALLAAAGAAFQRRSWWRALAPARVALVLVALAQIAITIPALLSGSYRGAPIHVAHEMGAFDMALGIGFLVAAWRPARAQGMRALVGCAALLLVVTAVLDIIAGRTTAVDECSHLLVVAGWLLLRRIAALAPLGERDQGLSIPLFARAWLELPQTRTRAFRDFHEWSEDTSRDGAQRDAEIQPTRRRAADGT